MPRSKFDASVAETEKLIELVRVQPCLYNVRLPEYRDANLHLNIWKSVSEKMGRGDMDETEWKKKWRNQRDGFMKKRRELRSKKSGQAAVSAKKWIFYDQMSFLEEFLEENRTETNVPDPFIEDNLDECSSIFGSPEVPAVVTIATLSDKTPEAGSESTLNEVSSEPALSQPAPKKKRGNVRKESDMEQALGVLINKHAERYEQPSRGADEMLFISYAHRLKTLSPRTTSYVKLQLSHIFFNAENQDTTSIPIVPLPSLPSQINVSDLINTAFTMTSNEG